MLQGPFQIGEARCLPDGEKALVGHPNGLLQEVQRDRIVWAGLACHMGRERGYACDLGRVRLPAVHLKIPGVLHQLCSKADFAVLPAKQFDESAVICTLGDNGDSRIQNLQLHEELLY